MQLLENVENTVRSTSNQYKIEDHDHIIQSKRQLKRKETDFTICITIAYKEFQDTCFINNLMLIQDHSITKPALRPSISVSKHSSTNTEEIIKI